MALLAASSSLSCLSLRCAQASASAPGTHSSRIAAVAPACAPLLTTPASVQCGHLNVQLGGSALAGALFAALASSDSAMAAQEMMNLAATDDNRGFGLLLTLVPAIAWVLFNILQPALNQFDRMKSAKGLAVGLGLGTAASLVIPSHADAAVQEIATLAADNDSRGLLLLIVLVPAIGWVLFNILKPALSQLDRMNGAKSVLGGLGLSGALLLCTSQADAAVQEMSSLADATASSDARGILLVAALVPALGWVLFNILQPALNQFDRMKASKGIAAAVGLGAASALLPLHADAIQELATVADSDSRGTLVLFVLVPAIGWVLFNILQPALKQFEKMK